MTTAVRSLYSAHHQRQQHCFDVSRCRLRFPVRIDMNGMLTCQKGGSMSADRPQATVVAADQPQSFAAPPLVDDRLNRCPRPEQTRG